MNRWFFFKFIDITSTLSLFAICYWWWKRSSIKMKPALTRRHILMEFGRDDSFSVSIEKYATLMERNGKTRSKWIVNFLNVSIACCLLVCPNSDCWRNNWLQFVFTLIFNGNCRFVSLSTIGQTPNISTHFFVHSTFFLGDRFVLFNGFLGQRNEFQPHFSP